MSQRVAEFEMRTKRFGPKLRFRVDLHGVSVFGPGNEHLLIRFEWIESIAVEDGAAVVRSLYDEIRFPAGAFGLNPDALAERLGDARSIDRRADVIGQLIAQ